MRTFEGGCHCGRVRFRITAHLEHVAECNCSICTKKGFLHLIVPPEHFELLRGKEELTTYEFNTGTAKHTFCRHCGIHAFYVPRSDPGQVQCQRSLPRRCRPDKNPARVLRREALGGGDPALRAVKLFPLDWV
jgi:hypothetical protein